MRILWLCNIVLPRIAKEIGEPIKNIGGWMTGILEGLEQEDTNTIGIIFPCSNNVKTSVDGITCYGFKKFDINLFKSYIKEFNPDVIHIFGTESYHSNCMIKAIRELDMLNHSVISIQGLVSVYSRHYTSYLPEKVISANSFRDMIKGNIKKQQNEFVHRGKYEEETLKITKHVIGRTDWDEACVKRLNPEVKYHFCNETLRRKFYESAGTWNIENCKQHSIFVSQYGYPLKGFHLMLEALSDILQTYPDTKLYVTGKNLFSLNTREKILEGSYSKYLRKLILDKGLESNIVFLGNLNEDEMCHQFLESHVFVCCSSIENSPNTLGEAMLVGTPCIASDVGGVRNMLIDKEEGFIYPADEPYMCAYYVKKVFADNELASKFSTEANKHASKTHDKDHNNKVLLDIYDEISK